jgi:hypothetical protein
LGGRAISSSRSLSRSRFSPTLPAGLTLRVRSSPPRASSPGSSRGRCVVSLSTLSFIPRFASGTQRYRRRERIVQPGPSEGVPAGSSGEAEAAGATGDVSGAGVRAGRTGLPSSATTISLSISKRQAVQAFLRQSVRDGPSRPFVGRCDAHLAALRADHDGRRPAGAERFHCVGVRHCTIGRIGGSSRALAVYSQSGRKRRPILQSLELRFAKRIIVTGAVAANSGFMRAGCVAKWRRSRGSPAARRTRYIVEIEPR